MSALVATAGADAADSVEGPLSEGELLLSVAAEPLEASESARFTPAGWSVDVGGEDEAWVDGDSFGPCAGSLYAMSEELEQSRMGALNA